MLACYSFVLSSRFVEHAILVSDADLLLADSNVLQLFLTLALAVSVAHPHIWSRQLHRHESRMQEAGGDDKGIGDRCIGEANETYLER
jgi:hypothetical protein